MPQSEEPLLSLLLSTLQHVKNHQIHVEKLQCSMDAILKYLSVSEQFANLHAQTVHVHEHLSRAEPSQDIRLIDDIIQSIQRRT